MEKILIFILLLTSVIASANPCGDLFSEKIDNNAINDIQRLQPQLESILEIERSPIERSKDHLNFERAYLLSHWDTDRVYRMGTDRIGPFIEQDFDIEGDKKRSDGEKIEENENILKKIKRIIRIKRKRDDQSFGGGTDRI